MAFHRKDHFYKKAKEEGMRSRASYKLEELHKRFQLFPKGGRVLDLGAAPGGWLQVAAEKVGPNGRVVGIDLLPIDPLPFRNMTLLQGDLLDPAVQQQAMDAMNGKAHTVLSDMAPSISGIRITDCARSYELAMIALHIAQHMLLPGGSMVVKIFPGDDFENYLLAAKNLFKKVRTTRPEATRKTSSEVYVIATQFRETPLRSETNDETPEAVSPAPEADHPEESA
ncbi:MAG: RlmE family RNA methyltransferase [Myxococcales bacterium]|nr:RlmE family RNA methyltransferase [Myxococcales bacterium]